MHINHVIGHFLGAKIWHLVKPNCLKHIIGSFSYAVIYVIVIIIMISILTNFSNSDFRFLLSLS